MKFKDAQISWWIHGFGFSFGTLGESIQKVLRIEGTKNLNYGMSRNNKEVYNYRYNIHDIQLEKIWIWVKIRVQLQKIYLGKIDGRLKNNKNIELNKIWIWVKIRVKLQKFYLGKIDGRLKNNKNIELIKIWIWVKIRVKLQKLYLDKIDGRLKNYKNISKGSGRQPRKGAVRRNPEFNDKERLLHTNSTTNTIYFYGGDDDYKTFIVNCSYINNKQVRQTIQSPDIEVSKLMKQKVQSTQERDKKLSFHKEEAIKVFSTVYCLNSTDLMAIILSDLGYTLVTNVFIHYASWCIFDSKNYIYIDNDKNFQKLCFKNKNQVSDNKTFFVFQKFSKIGNTFHIKHDTGFVSQFLTLLNLFSLSKQNLWMIQVDKAHYVYLYLYLTVAVKGWGNRSQLVFSSKKDSDRSEGWKGGGDGSKEVESGEVVQNSRKFKKNKTKPVIIQEERGHPRAAIRK